MPKQIAPAKMNEERKEEDHLKYGKTRLMRIKL
jgi:hypothetical protein